MYIDNSADITVTVRRVLWGKLINLGQTCIAPDYILCSRAIQDQFVATAKQVLEEWYGKNPQESPDLARIVSDKHFQ